MYFLIVRGSTSRPGLLAPDLLRRSLARSLITVLASAYGGDFPVSFGLWEVDANLRHALWHFAVLHEQTPVVQELFEFVKVRREARRAGDRPILLNLWLGSSFKARAQR
jgi:hypothetical protein